MPNILVIIQYTAVQTWDYDYCAGVDLSQQLLLQLLLLLRKDYRT